MFGSFHCLKIVETANIIVTQNIFSITTPNVICIKYDTPK